jgi:hypothetical protein
MKRVLGTLARAGCPAIGDIREERFDLAASINTGWIITANFIVEG